jgi:UDP-N-acetylmuramoyl-L-alanyl-D-glutamate--2,6-diaminopimelate ligase
MNSSICMPQTFPVTCHTDFVGQGSCFVAIEGYADNGINYIQCAIEKGARTIVVHHTTLLSDELCAYIAAHDVVVERVENTRKALAQYSARGAGFPAKQLKIIGITGTKGKTTTSFLLEHILRTASFKTALISSVKNSIGDHGFAASLTTPQPDYLQQFLKLCVEHNVEYVVMEVAAQALTLHRVEGITFCGVIFTNFSHEHLEFYPTLDDYFYAKSLLFTRVTDNAPMLINGDDEHGKLLLRKYPKARAYGFNDYSAHPECSPELLAKANVSKDSKLLERPFDTFLQAKNFQLRQGYVGHGRASGQENIVSPLMCPALFGKYNAYNILAAVSMALELSDISKEVINVALQSFAGVPGRLQEHVLPNGARCFIDYAHNPESFKAVLSTLRVLTDQLIVVFGAGGGRDKAKRPMMGAIAADIADVVCITSDNPRLENPYDIACDIIKGIPENVSHKIVQELDRKKAIELAYQLSDQGAIIVLLGKGPDEYQIVGTTKHYFSEREIVQAL